MRASDLVFQTQREDPHDAEVASHRLLVRGGYIRALASGVFSFLPLGFRVLERISRVIVEEWDRIGGNQVLLPALHPRELWDETGRSVTMDDVLMRVDSKLGELVLGPTHEEAVIAAVAPDLPSYRALPAFVYQIQTKFRDEPRARFGLMRTREFLMADGYTFDADRDGMRSSYQRIYDAYGRIYARLGLAAIPVEADAGSIGGDVNHEFMVASAIGEDRFASCGQCGYRANVEAARRGQGPEVPVPPLAAPTVYRTPGAPGVTEALAALAAQGAPVDDNAMLKCLVAYDPEGRTALLLVPGRRQARVPHGWRLAGEEAFAPQGPFALGYVGPLGMRERGVRLVADPSIRERAWWATGNNVEGEHIVGVRLGVDFNVDEWLDLVEVVDGDPCARCGAELALRRAVEVGHTFQLGVTYSAKMARGTFTSDDGKPHPYWMGCYGIGVSRLVAVIAEEYQRGGGIAWPLEVAPFEVAVLPAGKGEELAAAARGIAEELEGVGRRVILEDRPVSFGVAAADHELIGAPIWVVVGARALARGEVELRNRISEHERTVSLEDAVAAVAAEIGSIDESMR